MKLYREFIAKFSRLLYAAAVMLAMLLCICAAAQAQCTLTSGPGPIPWSTCTTWTGPNWVTELYNPLNGRTPPLLDSSDTNGDGLADLFYFGGSVLTPSLGIGLSSGSGFSSLAPSGPSGSACYQGNFDGSHRAGIACLATNSITYASSTGSGFNPTQTETLSGNIWAARTIAVDQPNPCLVMDVNGDGRDDIVCGSPQHINPPVPGACTGSGCNWGVYLATGSMQGTSAFTYQTWAGPTGSYTQPRYCLIGDFNGDGLKDLACQYDTTSTSWTMLLSTGTGWLGQIWTGPASGNLSLGTCVGKNTNTQLCGNPCTAGDFDGDGINDIACPTTGSAHYICSDAQ